MNKIVCSCGEYLYYNQGELRKLEFKKEHRQHLVGKFKIYPSDLLQIATNMNIENEDDRYTKQGG